jgi:hypothetical protein
MSAPVAGYDPRVARRKDGALKHTAACRMAFGRYDVAACARCEELAAGAPARADQSHGVRGRRARIDAELREEVRRHDCRVRRCGLVCTAFEW